MTDDQFPPPPDMTDDLFPEPIIGRARYAWHLLQTRRWWKPKECAAMIATFRRKSDPSWHVGATIDADPDVILQLVRCYHADRPGVMCRGEHSICFDRWQTVPWASVGVTQRRNLHGGTVFAEPSAEERIHLQTVADAANYGDWRAVRDDGRR